MSKKNTDAGRPLDQAAPADLAPAAPTPAEKTGRTVGARKPGQYTMPEKMTIEQAAKTWPDATPWPIPGPVHGKPGLTTLTGWDQAELLGGPTEVDDIVGLGTDVLLILITQAKAMTERPVIRQTTIARHDQYGEFFLRMVEQGEGFLVGVVDAAGATYCACEWYALEDEAAKAWVAWVDAMER